MSSKKKVAGEPKLFSDDIHPGGLNGRIPPQSKIEKYGWVILDAPGKFRMIHKSNLGIDHDYQRDHIKVERVNRIAAKWSYVRLGVLLVAQRPDGTLWVFDGQHRKLAADKRSDIGELPCMVYHSEGRHDEAGFFLDVNQDRGTVSMLDAYKSLLSKQDPTAISVEEMVRSTGYTVARGSANHTVQCVGALIRAMKRDPEATRVAWQVACGIFDGKAIIDRIYQGLFEVERHLNTSHEQTLLGPTHKKKVLDLSVQKIQKKILTTTEMFEKSTPKVWGQAIIFLLNKNRRGERIKPLYAEGIDDDQDA